MKQTICFVIPLGGEARLQKRWGFGQNAEVPSSNGQEGGRQSVLTSKEHPGHAPWPSPAASSTLAMSPGHPQQ